MKPDIHPTYHTVEATCVCGNVILTGSTRSVIKMEICSACHPFFTGTQKIVDTEGRVEKFKKRYTQADGSRKPTSRDKKAKGDTKGKSLAELKTKAVAPKPDVPLPPQPEQPSAVDASEPSAPAEPS